MLIFPEPTGPQVDPLHVPELDDAFFSSDPFAYFCARIQALSAEPAPQPYDSDTGRALLSLLQILADGVRTAGAPAVQLQQAVDAIGLRQHVAETLMRTWLTALQTRNSERAVSVWATLTDQPTQILQVLEQIGNHPDNGDPQVTLDLLYPPRLHHHVVPGSELARAADVLFSWVIHAEALLTRRDVPVNYGPWKTVYNRHRRWSGDGTWEQVLDQLRIGADGHDDGGEWLLGVDATVIRAHHHAAGARKSPPKDVPTERLAPPVLEVVGPPGKDTGGGIESQDLWAS